MGAWDRLLRQEGDRHARHPRRPQRSVPLQPSQCLSELLRGRQHLRQDHLHLHGEASPEDEERLLQLRRTALAASERPPLRRHRRRDQDIPGGRGGIRLLAGDAVQDERRGGQRGSSRRREDPRRDRRHEADGLPVRARPGHHRIRDIPRHRHRGSAARPERGRHQKGRDFGRGDIRGDAGLQPSQREDAHGQIQLRPAEVREDRLQRQVDQDLVHVLVRRREEGRLGAQGPDRERRVPPQPAFHDASARVKGEAAGDKGAIAWSER